MAVFSSVCRREWHCIT